MPLTFRESVTASTAPPITLKLPLCHVDSAKKIIDYIEGGRVQTDVVCDVFSEKLNYFFYGRAAYRPKESGATTVVIDRPAALIIAPDSVSTPYTVYPFDSGGFPRYAEPAAGHDLTDFALYNNVGECERIIERHWNSHDDYTQVNLDGFQRKIDPNCYAVESYSAIVRDLVSEVADDRRSSLEVTSKDDVLVNTDNIVGLVLPYGYAGRESVQNLAAAGLKVEKYGYRQKDRAADMAVVIELGFKIVEQWAKSRPHA